MAASTTTKTTMMRSSASRLEPSFTEVFNRLTSEVNGVLKSCTILTSSPKPTTLSSPTSSIDMAFATNANHDLIRTLAWDRPSHPNFVTLVGGRNLASAGG
ncbi:hypothetical protein KC324_g58 [Hortaea werneckii]|nr:hypothetical protein KC324_g58 [Hortaea werneckii]